MIHYSQDASRRIHYGKKRTREYVSFRLEKQLVHVLKKISIYKEMATIEQLQRRKEA